MNAKRKLCCPKCKCDYLVNHGYSKGPKIADLVQNGGRVIIWSQMECMNGNCKHRFREDLFDPNG